MSCGAPSRITRTRGALSTASRSSVRLARSSCAMPISALVTSTMPNRASCGWPSTRITASKTPRMKLNRVKMFARKISATGRLVRSPPPFASPRERRSATWALVRPAAGVSAIAAPGASGVEATASATPGHRAAAKGQPNARPSRGRLPASSTASLPPALRLTVPQTPSVQVAPLPIVTSVVAAIAIPLASGSRRRRPSGWGREGAPPSRLDNSAGYPHTSDI